MTDRPEHDIIDAIRHAMDEDGVTVSELARRAGKTRPQVSQWLHRRKQPSAQALEDMAEALGRRWILDK